jgi:hypothetical protein
MKGVAPPKQFKEDEDDLTASTKRKVILSFPRNQRSLRLEQTNEANLRGYSQMEWRTHLQISSIRVVTTKGTWLALMDKVLMVTRQIHRTTR